MSRRDRDRALACRSCGPGRPGTPLTAERAAYFGLVEDGVGTREAARRVGVNYRTAKRWRAEAAQAAATAVPVAPAEVSSRFLSRQPGTSLRMIAAELGRPVSTISRELARNQ